MKMTKWWAGADWKVRAGLAAIRQVGNLRYVATLLLLMAGLAGARGQQTVTNAFLSTPNTGLGEPLRTCLDHLNVNDNWIYSLIGANASEVLTNGFKFAVTGSNNFTLSAGFSFIGAHSGDGSGLTGLSASALASGTIPQAETAALTGDVTKSAGSGATTLAHGSAGNLDSGTLALARGGTGASLSAPAADKLWGWDNTDTAVGFWVIGSGLTYTHSTHTLSASASGGGGTNSGPIALSLSGTNLAVNAVTPNGCVTNAVLKYRFTLTTNVLVQNPTGAGDGQTIELILAQDATGNRLVYFDTQFNFGTDITGTNSPTAWGSITATANKTTHAVFEYWAASNRWDVVGVTRGY